MVQLSIELICHILTVLYLYLTFETLVFTLYEAYNVSKMQLKEAPAWVSDIETL